MSSPCCAGLALNPDQFLGSDLIAVMGGVGAGILRAHRIDDAIDAFVRMAQKHAAGLVRIALLAVPANRVELGLLHPEYRNRAS